MRPNGTPVRITLISADKEAVESAVWRLQRADPYLALTGVAKTKDGAWAAMGTMFVGKESKR